MQKIIAYCVLFIVYLFIAPLAQASGEFQADYAVQYAVAPSGITIVTQNITLTNLQTNLYPQKYTILIDSIKIHNVIAYDPGGVIPTDISQANGKTQIGLTFNEKVVGIGKRLPFTLRYESTDIATKNGSIWEINIPGVASDPDLESYEVSLNVPNSFGPNAYMVPMPTKSGKWTKDQMTRGGISAAYGEQQVFDIQLTYYIENLDSIPTSREIALPPNTAFQRVSLQSLDPKPIRMTSDIDGNWLATYELKPNEQLSISAHITIRVQLDPLPEWSKGKILDTSLYIKPLRYWESEHEKIKTLAQTHKTPRDIYQYVVTTLDYDYSRAETGGIRKGAVEVLNTPHEAICMEFTDLFIAIARAAGIPAREAVGYSFTNNARLRPLSLVSDVLHAWPEYYDTERGIWVPVDPTWAKTTGGINYFDKLDFNHITFALLGQSSEYPYPAGFYKKPGAKSKDVLVQFAHPSVFEESNELDFTYTVPSIITAGFTTPGEVRITNIGRDSIVTLNVDIQSNIGAISIKNTYENVLPLEQVQIPINIISSRYFESGDGLILVTINGDTKQIPFKIQPILVRYAPYFAGGVFIIILIFILWIRTIHFDTKNKKVYESS